MTDDQDPVHTLSRAEVRAIAREAGHHAVKDFLEKCGVDVDSNDDVKSFRADLVHAHQMRRMGESAKARAWMIFVTAVVTGFFVFAWTGIKSAIGLGKG